MSKPIIEVKNLSKVYNIGHEQKSAPGTLTFRDSIVQTVRKPMEIFTGHKMEKEKFWALKDINFEINQGDVVGIIGRNGSGKSTLLKLLSRIVEPTEGEIVMRGRVASLLEVGTGFHPELTGRENVFFNGAILGMSQKEIKSKFDEIVAFSEVEKFLDTPVKFYSSGMYVRLAFAVAAHLDPDILIVDEVLAVGDAAFQKKCLGKMKDVAGQGRTVLFVSHSMPAVKALCTKAIWLKSGQIEKQGSLEQVTDAYMADSMSSQESLSKRPRTSRVTGEARIVDIKVANLPTRTSGTIDSTEKMVITFVIDTKQALDGVILHCGISAAGQIVLRLMSEYQGKEFSLKKGTNRLSCVIDPSYLTGGTYSIDCSILYPGREQLGHIDEVFDAITFAVKDLQVPNTTTYLTQREAVFYTEHEWQIVESR